MKWRPKFFPELGPFDGLTRAVSEPVGLAVTLGRPLVRVPAVRWSGSALAQGCCHVR
jgi:hypothetical protein